MVRVTPGERTQALDVLKVVRPGVCSRGVIDWVARHRSGAPAAGTRRGGVPGTGQAGAESGDRPRERQGQGPKDRDAVGKTQLLPK